MYQYKLNLSYNGSEFFGWQSQPHRNTIQDRCEAALKTIIGKDIRIRGASRTDSGVHADEQIAVFRTENSVGDLDRFLLRFNCSLPSTININAIEEVPLSFNPCRHATGKIYCYTLYLDSSPTSHLPPFNWRIYKPLNIELLQAEIKSLQGTHDFSSFCAADSNAKSKVRTIFDTKFKHSDNKIEIWFYGSGFLKQMIRIIMGTVVELAKGDKSTSLQEILQAKDRLRAYSAAPAQGLCLKRILYSEFTKELGK